MKTLHQKISPCFDFAQPERLFFVPTAIFRFIHIFCGQSLVKQYQIIVFDYIY